MITVVQFLHEVTALKRLPRKGWVLRKIKDPESVADHSFRLAVMAMVLSNGRNLNREKLIKMALVHDLVEIFAGDTTPYDDLLAKGGQSVEELVKRWPGRTKEEKVLRKKAQHDKELAGLKQLTAGLSPKHREEIVTLWDEYECNLSREAKFVKQLDKIENLMQALEYQKIHPELPVRPFWLEVESLVDDPKLLEFLRELNDFYQSDPG